MNMEANSSKISKTLDLQNPLYMGNDRIGELPDVLLHRILSFLRTKHAVQTSILSRRWRHLWTSVDSLNFDIMDFTSDKSFGRFIHQVLSLRDTQLDVLNFRISWPWIASTDINTLICYASDHKAESMEIDCWRPCLQFSNPSLGCSLRVLKLVRGWLGGQPGLQIFHNLKTLHISDTWAQIPLEELIHNCPALEELSLKSSSFLSLKICSSKLVELAILGCTSHDGRIELSCSNLVALSYRNPSMDCALENLSSLSNAYFCWFGHKGVLKFLNGLCYVKVLTLDCLHLESIYKEALDGSLPIRFPNLVSLTIKSCPISMNVHAQAIAFLLLNSPALETLIIDHSTGYDHSLNYLRKRKFMGLKGGGWPPNGLCFECLKVVEFRKFGCSVAETELLKFVSQNARVLERITVFPKKKIMSV